MKRRCPSGRALGGALALLALGVPVSARADVPDETVSQAEAELALVKREVGSVEAAIGKVAVEKTSPEARLASGESPSAHEGLRARQRRLQRDPGGVSGYTVLSGRALPARRDVLRLARIPRFSPRLPRGREQGGRPALPAVRQPVARAAGRCRAPHQRPLRTGGGLRAPRGSAAGPGRRWAHLRQGQGLLRQARLRKRAAGVRGRPERHAVHAPGAVLPGPRGHEGRPRCHPGAGSRRHPGRPAAAVSQLQAGDRGFPRRDRAAAGQRRAQARH